MADFSLKTYAPVLRFLPQIFLLFFNVRHALCELSPCVNQFIESNEIIQRGITSNEIIRINIISKTFENMSFTLFSAT